MKHHTLAYLFITLFIGLTMVSFVFGSQPLAAETLQESAALTETFTPAPTNTPVPVDTNTPVPVDTNTPVPVITNTPVPVITNTPAPAATNTPAPAALSTVAAIQVAATLVTVSAETPTAPAVVGFPDTGGNPRGGETPSWILLLVAAFVTGLGGLVFKLTTSTQR